MFAVLEIATLCRDTLSVVTVVVSVSKGIIPSSDTEWTSPTVSTCTDVLVYQSWKFLYDHRPFTGSLSSASDSFWMEMCFLTQDSTLTCLAWLERMSR